MLTEELKNLVSQIGTLVIVENNQPKFIVMSYNKFEGMIIHKSIDPSAGSGLTLSGYQSVDNSVDNSGNFYKDIKDNNEEIMDRLNKEITVLKEEVAEKEKQLIANE